ncbi:hypothetical protein Vadar_032371 [Vaccinium darrowii]|uniref:Uncharacterized protein n=1 Tax=Vaccinium darrowii TaxID=229202 RepID=A0ACB7ZGT4_9ERIC|nr:hypothetical protein Vadar_032371 [Vaccinium darrowii]
MIDGRLRDAFGVVLSPLRSALTRSSSDFPDSHLPLILTMAETETPFRPREKLIEKQKFYQSIHKHTYLKGPYDKLTSVAIPAALAASCLFMIGRGIYNMSNGIGKKE